MESPLLQTRACPSCPGLIAGADPHHLCLECLGDQDMAEAVPFTFAIPARRMAPIAGEEDDEDFSLSGTSGSGVHEGPPPRSVRQDFPLVMTMAAERVGLPLPPPLPPKPVSRLRQGFYGPVRPAQPAFVSPPLPDIWQCLEASWQQPLKTKAPHS